MIKNLVIVESPAKAKTIERYLGADYKVMASYGHIRELPSKKGSVDPENDFFMLYQLSANSKAHFKKIISEMKKIEKLILATDPDREGEAISWHIVDELTAQKKITKKLIIERVSFNEITKKAVQYAVDNPREIDYDLVRAQQSRQALDYLVGFTLSPVLWKKLPGSKSAGRVQSVALRMICEREGEIEKFIQQEYWSIKGLFANSKKDDFSGDLVVVKQEKLEKFSLPNESLTKETVEFIKKQKEFKVLEVENKESKRNPAPPFTTSTLQQASVQKLHFSTRRTMQLAQKLYEGVEINGKATALITYMRTDSINLSDTAITGIRSFVQDHYGKDYLSAKKVVYKSKAKNTQEAHEAIRPIEFSLPPEVVKDKIDKDLYALYKMIWNRAIACQMKPAVFDKVVINVGDEKKNVIFRVNGSILKFKGFLRAYVISDDDGKNEHGDDVILPDLKKGDVVDLKNCQTNQHFTQAPPRFSEATIVKELEKLGVGRPSTYSSIISVLIDRGYCNLDKGRFFPQERGRIVTAFLCEFFGKYIEYDFTAKLEEDLDLISAGKLDWKEFLNAFWSGFSNIASDVGKKEISEIVTEIERVLYNYLFGGASEKTKDGKETKSPNDQEVENDAKGNICKKCTDGKLGLRYSRYGFFVGCSNYPDCDYRKSIGESVKGDDADEGAEAVNKLIYEDKEEGVLVHLKKGPYGWYLEESEINPDPKNKKKKKKRATVPAHYSVDKMDKVLAKNLLSLPKKIGLHPETQKDVVVSFGPYGSYILHDKKYTNFDHVKYDIFEIGINLAMTLMAEAANKKGGAGGKDKKTSNVLQNLGKYPDGDDIELCKGRYGPYLKYQKTNIKIPKEISIENISLDDAIKLVSEKIS